MKINANIVFSGALAANETRHFSDWEFRGDSKLKPLSLADLNNVIAKRRRPPAGITGWKTVLHVLRAR